MAEPSSNAPQQNARGAGPQQSAPVREEQVISGFTVEFGDDYLRNHTINTPPFQGQVRGEFSLARLSKRPEGSRDVGSTASRIPDLPGMRLSIDIRRKQGVLFDPCEEGAGKAALERYNLLAKGTPALEPYRFVEKVEHDLTDHQLKTIIIELRQKLKTGNCRVVQGEFPTDQQIESLKGRELNDPWNQGRKPMFKDQLEDWEQSAAARV